MKIPQVFTLIRTFYAEYIYRNIIDSGSREYRCVS